MAVKRNKGLCYYCEDRWVSGHRCQPHMHLLIADDDGDNLSLQPIPDLPTPPHKPAPCPESDDTPQLNLHAMSGMLATNHDHTSSPFLGLDHLPEPPEITTPFLDTNIYSPTPHNYHPLVQFPTIFTHHPTPTPLMSNLTVTPIAKRLNWRIRSKPCLTPGLFNLATTLFLRRFYWSKRRTTVGVVVCTTEPSTPSLSKIGFRCQPSMSFLTNLVQRHGSRNWTFDRASTKYEWHRRISRKPRLEHTKAITNIV